MPGDWNGYDQATAQNCVEEAHGKAGRTVEPTKIIAVQDQNHHNKPVIATNITKTFYLCKEINGKSTPNDETGTCGYFSLNNLPKLSLGRSAKEQIAMCFDANNDPDWDTKFE